jgi:molecular chaperone GrpE
VTDHDDRRSPASPIRVVDRRWWAREDGEPGGDAGAAPSRKPAYVEELEQRLAEKDALLQSTVMKYREAAAEFDEARARQRKEIAKDVERGRRVLLVELLDVVDSLDRAIDAAHGSAASETWLQGIDLVRQQFLAKLEGFGVTRLAALDQPFDPARHEAVTTVPVADPSQDHVIVGVVRHGYAIGDEILRPAQVAVGRTADPA